ncbi:MAG TPA: hypothetical protein VFZ25_10560 [Chloroflexota bacterium]|nr:hypothetical protein [Chloroflexota bacterium]
MNPVAILWRSVVDVYDNLFPMVGMNLLWLVLSIPLVVVVSGVLVLFQVEPTLAGLLALLLAMLAPSPASVGIHNYVSQIAKDERVEFDLFWAGLKTYWRKSLLLFGISIVMLVLLGVNLYFYLTNSATWLHYLAILWFYAGIVWLIMLTNMAALLVEQEDKGIKLILRNAFLLALDNAIPSIVLLIVLLVIGVVSIGITLLVALLGGAFVATVQTRAVQTYLEKYRARAASNAGNR